MRTLKSLALVITLTSVNAMAELKLTKDEKKFMAKTCPYIDLPMN